MQFSYYTVEFQDLQASLQNAIYASAATARPWICKLGLQNAQV